MTQNDALRLGRVETNDVLDDFSSCVSKVVKTFKRKKLLTERYGQREVAVHVHLRLRPRDDAEFSAQDFCAVYERLVVDEPALADELDALSGDASVRTWGVRPRAHKDRPVFVRVAQLVEQPEGIVFDAVPSVVRLYVLDIGEQCSGLVEPGERALPLGPGITTLSRKSSAFLQIGKATVRLVVGGTIAYAT